MIDAGYRIDKDLELIIKSKFAPRLLIIQNQRDAIHLFQDAIRLPQKSTKIRIKTSYHLLLDDEFSQSRRTTVIRGFSTITREPKILKFSPSAPKEHQIFQQLGLNTEESLQHHLVPLEQLIEDINGKKAVVMPMFLCSIDVLPALPEDNLLSGFKELMKAVNRLHASNIIHNDIKPLNILMNLRGSWYLCDYGSCCNIGNQDDSIDCTPMYIPRDFKQRCTKSFDYLLVIVTILDRFTGGEFCRNKFTIQNVKDQISTFENVELKESLMNLCNQCVTE